MSDGITFGGIGTIDNTTAETATDATPRKVGSFNVDGESSRVTVSVGAGTLTVVEAGTYDIQGNFSFSGTLSKTFKMQVYKNTTAIGPPLERKLGTGGDVGVTSCRAIAVLDVGDVISVYHWSTDGGTAFTIRQASFAMIRLK